MCSALAVMRSTSTPDKVVGRWRSRKSRLVFQPARAAQRVEPAPSPAEVGFV